MDFREKLERMILDSLLSTLNDKLVAVVLFGSVARNEFDERSDIDVFIVTDGLTQFETSFNRRRYIYNALTPLIIEFRRDITLIEIEERELNELGSITPLLLNIAWDGYIIYDKSGKLTMMLKEIKKAVRKSGLERYKTIDGKYGWKLKYPGQIVEVQI